MPVCPVRYYLVQISAVRIPFLCACRLHVCAIESYPVRLTGGSNVYEGQVEVLHCDNNSSCTWRTVCASEWDVNEASVTCRQLGLYTGTSKFIIYYYFHHEFV